MTPLQKLEVRIQNVIRGRKIIKIAHKLKAYFESKTYVDGVEIEYSPKSNSTYLNIFIKNAPTAWPLIVRISDHFCDGAGDNEIMNINVD